MRSTPTKLADSTVVELDARTAVAAKLEQLIHDLEAAERVEERKRALRDEREGQEKRLALADRLGPDGKHTITIGLGGGHFQVDRSGAELKATAQRRIAEVDAELERVERDGVADPRGIL